MIEVDGLRKVFRVHKKEPGLKGSLKALFRREKIEKPAVKGVSFRVDEGEIVGLIGANGAGKTTLVKMLAGIIHPTSGSASVLGFTPWERDNRLRRQISLIMGQKAQLWWDLPAADCFLLLREIYRVPEQQYRETLDYLSGVLDVKKELNVQIRRLSLGERMKMELIAALLHRPRVVFLDEPTIGLDLTAQRAIRDFILEYRRVHRPAMILTSHYMEDIQRLCERIVIIREGEFVYDGSLVAVVQRYAQSKVIRAHLRRTPEPVRVDGDLRALGEVVACSPEELCLRVPRTEVARASAWILERYPVLDLAIEEMDIGTIIERIFRERGEVGGFRGPGSAAPGATSAGDP
ncbi:MAG TPA: ATP-binding cassette domain-containing protein [Planctomycetota bacterium]|nr:ATP-binding cassette domain-containing protein [Planctomycetota bacterium]